MPRPSTIQSNLERWLLGRKWLSRKARKRIRAELSPAYIRFMDCDFLVHPADNYSEFVLWETRQTPEVLGTSTVAKLLEHTDATIVDVGGNAGLFFIPILRAAGPSARAIVFEPNPVMQARLKNNLQMNDMHNVDVFENAVSDVDGQSPLFFPNGKNLGQGRIEVKYNTPKTREGVNVGVRVLADCLAEAKVEKIDFLKVDVEGLEDRVIYPLLTGPKHLLPNYIYFEVAHDKHWKYPLMETLADRGYKLLDDFGANHLYELQMPK